MTDKKIEADIKALKAFLEFWGRFHSIYSDIISKEIITGNDESKFLETKAMMAAKYGELNKALGFKYMPHGRLTDPVSDIFSMKTIRFVSEENLKRIEDNWKVSYIFLNNIMEQLKSRKSMAEDSNPVSGFFRRIFAQG